MAAGSSVAAVPRPQRSGRPEGTRAFDLGKVRLLLRRRLGGSAAGRGVLINEPDERRQEDGDRQDVALSRKRGRDLRGQETTAATNPPVTAPTLWLPALSPSHAPNAAPKSAAFSITRNL